MNFEWMTQQLWHWVFLAQVFSTLAMTGIIWLVQVVHYPLMAWVNRPDFTEYSQRHTQFITLVVGPLMLVEAATTVLLLYSAERLGIDMRLAWLGLALLGIIWAATAFLSVPCHDVLTQRFDAEVLNRLVQSNWLRTIAWSFRSLLLLLILKQLLK